jgi:hypothetical protein
MRRFIGSLLFLFLIAVAWAYAEYTFFTPRGSFAVEVSLENSSYLRLPIYRNAITSLEVVGDYAIGGTSADAGLSPFLFAVSLSRRQLELVLDLARVMPGQRAIRSGFGRASGGVLYAGTMPDRAGGDGHLIQVQIKGKAIEAIDMGVPVAGEGVFALAADNRLPVLYGISHPSGKFFAFDLKDHRARVFEQTAPTKKTLAFLHGYVLQPEDFLSRRLAVDRKGRVFGSMPVSRLFRFDPAAQKVEVLPDPIPEVWGRRPLGQVDVWASGPDGMLYGGNAGDGQLFRLDPDSGKVTNLGKPVMMPRLKGLAFGANGKLYGVGGAAPGYAHLFTYDAKVDGFVDLGNPRFTMVGPGIEQGIWWRGFQIGTLAASEDGRFIVLGEEEALSQLMVFPIDAK